MNKIRNILFPLVFIVVSSVILVGGFSYLGVLPEIKLPVIDFPAIPGIFNSDNKETYVKSNAELADELVYNLQNSGIQKNSLSSDMIALWLDLNSDFDSSQFSDTDELKYYIFSEFDYYRNFTPNTIFIRSDAENEYSGFRDTDNKQFDVLAYTLYYADELKCDSVLVADETVLFNSSDKLDFDKLKIYLSHYDFAGVLISCESLFGTSEFYSLVNQVSSYINNEFPELAVGVEVATVAEKLFATDDTIRIFEEGLCDFGYVDCGFATSDEVYPFFSVAYWWSTFAEHYDVPFYCEHRADKIFSDADKWSQSTEINEQIKALYDCPAFNGSCFYSISSIKNKKHLARDLSIYLNDVSETRQDALSVETLVIDSDADTVRFTGKANENTSVYCSQKLIRNDKGSFNVTYNLDKSVNVFDFRSNGASYSYIIENNMDLISAYHPTESVVINKRSVLHTYAVSPEGARVFAIINGNVFEMQVYSPAENITIPTGYCYYSCDISMEKLDFDSAPLTILCYYNGNSFTADCGYVCRKNADTSDAGFSSDINSDNHISPYTDNGLGQSVLCRINYDNTEQIGKANDYDTYKPYNSALLKGTIDYLDKIDVTPEGYLVYELKSGINVYGVDSVLINDGYNMPQNNVRLVEFNDTASDYTEFKFRLDWLSPVTVSPQNQDYKVGYRDFSFNIEEFNAQYIDLNFYYCNPVSFEQAISFSANSVFSFYEVFTTSANGCLLRLYLKQPGKFYGFDLIHNSDGTVSVVFQKRTDNLLSGKVVMLDPGHGGISMVGTAVADNSVSESKVTLNIAYYTKQYLENMGATVIMTRSADTSLPLSSRTYMCETQNPDIFVSIHCDGSEDKNESGTHTFYFTPFSQPLARWIHNSLVKAYTETIYTESDENFETIDRKIKYYPFYVTRVDNCPSVLIETGFMTNFVEGNVLINPVNQDKIAKAIANGIADYFSYS